MATNWSGNFTYSSEPIKVDRIDQAAELVAKARKVRTLGSRHSFNSIADSEEGLLDLSGMNRVLGVDLDRGFATVEGGIIYSKAAAELQAEGAALHNLASLPHISIAGAIATATHGSGDANGNLATAVRGIEFLGPDGNLRWVREGDPEFPGSVVHLGVLGVVAKLELKIEPSFQVRQDVYLDLPLQNLFDHFDKITGAAYSVSLFTRWRGPEVEQVWLKRRSLDPAAANFFEARLADRQIHPIIEMDATWCTVQTEPGPWHERLPHFRPDQPPSGAGAELQSEYLVPRRNAIKAIRQVSALGPEIAPALLTSEIRTMAADGLWMSPSCDEPCVGIHFTWKKEPELVASLLPHLEDRLLPLGAKPHWGKLFHTPGVASAYRKHREFRELAQRVDPDGKFWNPFLVRAWDTPGLG